MKQQIQAIRRLGDWLSRLPYENLTKRREGSPREPEKVIRAHGRSGAGGTCFSLVQLGYEQAVNQGLEPAYYLGDRPGGEDRHAVLGFPGPGLFLDPGYLTYTPVPLAPPSLFRLNRSFNTLVLEPLEGNQLRVSTRRKKQDTWRHTLTIQPVSRERFREAWRASFGWHEVMDSKILTRRTDRGMLLYLNGRLDLITRENRTRLKVPEGTDATTYLQQQFGVCSPDLLRDVEIEGTE